VPRRTLGLQTLVPDSRLADLQTRRVADFRLAEWAIRASGQARGSSKDERDAATFEAAVAVAAQYAELLSADSSASVIAALYAELHSADSSAALIAALYSKLLSGDSSATLSAGPSD
jgi:hypothetical protein